MQVLADGPLVDEGDAPGRQCLLRLALGDLSELLRVVLSHKTCSKELTPNITSHTTQHDF